MARNNSDDLLMDDELEAAFLGGGDELTAPAEEEAAPMDAEAPVGLTPMDEEDIPSK